jgi:hypothetical protein
MIWCITYKSHAFEGGGLFNQEVAFLKNENGFRFIKTVENIK